ncbi:MAG: DUF2383 domain-containing protein [Rickettsiaceae bacterium]|nr:DUF2383 domain-containing protein [Rickettsiaceae bacterium]
MTTVNLEDTAKTLQELCQYEIDGSFIISQAIDNINNNEIKTDLTRIKQEYENNIKQLASMIKECGGEVPSYSKDFKGFFMQGYTSLRGLTGDQGILNALDTNIKMVIKAFEKVLNSDLPENVRSQLQKIHNNGQEHLNYVAGQI